MKHTLHINDVATPRQAGEPSNGLVRWGRGFALAATIATPVLGVTAFGLSAAGCGGGGGGVSNTTNTQATEGELDALTHYQDGELITARRLAEEVLLDNSNSFYGHYVLGGVLWENEGSHARAIRHLGRARQLYESTWTDLGAGPWELHRALLYSTQAAAAEMEQYDYQLELITYYDALYDPDLVAERSWPLLHMQRYDEAREVATAATELQDQWQRQLGWNAMCAIEASVGDRAARHEACDQAFLMARARNESNPNVDPETATNIAVHSYNAALARLGDLGFAEAQEAAAYGTSRLAFTPANPWRFLVELYMVSGQMRDAVNGLFEMRRWQQRQPPQLRDQSRAETDAVLAQALLVAGETDRALMLIERAIAYPDRQGLTTLTQEQVLAAHSIVELALYAAAEERRAESGVSGSVFRHQERLYNRADAWLARQRIRNAASVDDRLVRTFRPYYEGGIDGIPTWLIGDLIEVVGVGVSLAAIRRAREIEADDRFDGYFDAYEAEARYHQGRWSRCAESAELAYAALPRTEVLLGARNLAIWSECARRDGDLDTWHSQIQGALMMDPSVVRRLGLSIPAQVTTSGGLGDIVLERLDRSPRFEDGDLFRLDVWATVHEARACFSGATLVETCDSWSREDMPMPEVDLDEDEVDEDALWEDYLVARAHQAAFAMPLGISSLSLNTLDGRVTSESDSVRQDVRRALEGVLNPNWRP